MNVWMWPGAGQAVRLLSKLWGALLPSDIYRKVRKSVNWQKMSMCAQASCFLELLLRMYSDVVRMGSAMEYAEEVEAESGHAPQTHTQQQQESEPRNQAQSIVLSHLSCAHRLPPVSPLQCATMAQLAVDKLPTTGDGHSTGGAWIAVVAVSRFVL